MVGPKPYSSHDMGRQCVQFLESQDITVDPLFSGRKIGHEVKSYTQSKLSGYNLWQQVVGLRPYRRKPFIRGLRGFKKKEPSDLEKVLFQRDPPQMLFEDQVPLWHMMTQSGIEHQVTKAIS
jgi:hypothetical protein